MEDDSVMQKVLSSNHHKNLLSEMFKFIEAESLTDVTFLCQHSKPVYAHRKVLLHSSALFRKMINWRPKDERLCIIVDDIPQETMTSFLSLVYKGEAKQVGDLDRINQVCRMLGSDLAAVQLDKTAPKESSARKKRVLLGGLHPVFEKKKMVSEQNDQKAVASSSPTHIEPKPTPKNEDRPNKRTNPDKPSQNHSNRKKRKSQPPDTDNDQETMTKYCLCREPERPGMIGCDFCDEWYHTSCLNLTKDDARQLTKQKWKCPKCDFADSKKAKDETIETGDKIVRKKRKKSKSSGHLSSSSSSSSSDSGSGSSSGTSSSSSSSSDSSSSSESSDNSQKPNSKVKQISRNGSSKSSPKLSPAGPRRDSSEELFFCYLCKSIFVSQSAKEKHDKENHS